MDEWITALAKKAAACAPSPDNSLPQREASSSCSAPIERRLEKKSRRNATIISRARERQTKQSARKIARAKVSPPGVTANARRGRKRWRSSQERDTSSGDDGGSVAERRAIMLEITKVTGRNRGRLKSSGTLKTHGGVSTTSCTALSTLSAVVLRTSGGWDKVRRPRQYVDPANETIGKATKRSRYEMPNIQPRVGDYGGLGFARPSLFLNLLDPSFIPKFREEYAEHIPGFFGRARSKVMKKQLDSDMLWRRLAEKKRGGGRGGPDKDWDERKYNGKKLEDLHPDERVDAMIKLGML